MLLLPFSQSLLSDSERLKVLLAFQLKLFLPLACRRDALAVSSPSWVISTSGLFFNASSTAFSRESSIQLPMLLPASRQPVSTPPSTKLFIFI